MATQSRSGHPWGAIVLIVVFFVGLLVVGGLSYVRHQGDVSGGTGSSSSNTHLGAHTFVTG